MDTVIVLGAVPEAAEIEPKFGKPPTGLIVAVQFSVPPPVLVMVRFCEGGLGPPAVAENVMLVGLRVMVGGVPDPTVRLTGTVRIGPNVKKPPQVR
jgi:hypothetical protein